jgi:hypothetical protein
MELFRLYASHMRLLIGIKWAARGELSLVQACTAYLLIHAINVRDDRTAITRQTVTLR